MARITQTHPFLYRCPYKDQYPTHPQQWYDAIYIYYDTTQYHIEHIYHLHHICINVITYMLVTSEL